VGNNRLDIFYYLPDPGTNWVLCFISEASLLCRQVIGFWKPVSTGYRFYWPS